MPGPAPDPNAQRRLRKDDQGTWTTLPADGRSGEPPTWPLTRPTAAELRQWTREWQRPQAVMWEQGGQVEEVAVYVRTLLRGQDRNARADLLGLVLRQQEALGVSQPGLLKRRWRIVSDAPQVVQRPTGTESVKSRFKVLSGGG